MVQRPENLFPLFGDLTKLPGIGPKLAVILTKAGLEKPRDLLFHLPYTVTDRRLRKTLKNVPVPGVFTVEVDVGIHKPSARKGLPYRVFVHDSETEFQIVFFNASRDWIVRSLPHGQKRLVSGKVELFDGMLQMPHPDHILLPNELDQLPQFEPVYRLTAGVTQKTMTKAVSASLEMVPSPDEWIDPSLMKDKGWPYWRDALDAVHNPQADLDAASVAPARERLAYDEFLSHQTTLALARRDKRKKPGQPTIGDGTLAAKVLEWLPFEPTGAQQRSFDEIKGDLASKTRMNRLLQGDVGAGKTLVAMLAALTVVEAGGQAAIMAPTEILARQHLSGLKPMAEAAGVTLDCLTGRNKGGDRVEKLARLQSGETQILVGTHALFQSDVAFDDLRFAVIDEQHRFGVHQRMALGAKGAAVDILVMTATPIPRSLELAHYGDMDVSVLDEKPPGRKPVETVLIGSDRLDAVVERMRSALAAGKQAYWVCPLVTESEVIEATAAEARFAQLRAALGEDAVTIVHGQMPPGEKDAAMASFISGEKRLLVATTVIEVGVDVPNASIMVIEGAQSFGLAQLHQLRGRVGRGAEASSCLLMYDPPLGETAQARLKIMRETDDGFRIAEEDLRLRGAGDVLGSAQSGLPRFQIADPETQTDLMKIAQSDARALLDVDPSLRSKRGEAMRVLLHLMEREKSFSMISVG